MKIITDDHCTQYAQAGHPERPARISETVKRLREQRSLALEWARPTHISDDSILRAHEADLLKRLEVEEDFDADTPFYPEITRYARNSAAAALDALRAAQGGETVLSLMRPPGHHATREKSMGFCFLNNVAIAALEALATGAKRVAVFDFDVHHGNGTEEILLNQPGIEFFSVHHYPAYPHTGAKNRGHNCYNYPVEPYAVRETHVAALIHAIADLKQFRPDMVAVSAGFDAYHRDPVGNGQLLTEDFYKLGLSLRALNCPMFSVLEGGYSRDLPELIFAYLRGLAGLDDQPLSTEQQ